jgi:hypothetical protein
MFNPTDHPMHTPIRALAVIAALVAASIIPPRVSAEETWVRVTSHDNKVSVLFPSHPDKIETLSRKSPAGTINTRRAQYETEGVLLSISGTQLPSAALKLAGTNKILRNAAQGVLDTYLGKKVSEKKMKISGEPAVVLEYLVPDYDDKDHPGYRGIAIALLVDQTLYVVNGILTREDPKSKANQQKLLGSIEVHD